MSTNLNVEAYNDIYIYPFSRRFYPKRLTVHLGYIYFFLPYVCSLGIEPTTFCAANTMLYHWATWTQYKASVYEARIKEKLWFSQCGRTWLVCRMVYSHFIHFETVATEVEIQFLSTQIMFPSLLPQFGSTLFSSKEGGVPVILSI